MNPLILFFVTAFLGVPRKKIISQMWNSLNFNCFKFVLYVIYNRKM